MVRGLRPGDALALYLSKGSSLCNAAASKDILQQGLTMPVAQLFLANWLYLRGKRHTWVQRQGTRIRGVVSAVERPSSVWEIDYLILSQEDEGLCFELLDCLGHTAAETRIAKVLLRLESDSSLVKAAKSAGFSPYLKEQLYCCTRDTGMANATAFPSRYNFHSLCQAERYPVYTLYKTAVPLAVRQVEGITFGEWEETRRRWTGFEGSRELVLDREDKPVGWVMLRPVGKSWQARIMAHPSVEHELASALVQLLAYLRCGTLFCLVPDFQSNLQQVLAGHGFQPVKEYVSLARLNTLKACLPSLAPMQA